MKTFIKLSSMLVCLIVVFSCSKKDKTSAPLIINSVSRSADTVGATVTCLGENLSNPDGKVILSCAERNAETNVFEPNASAFKFTVPEIEPGRYKLSYTAAGSSSNEADFQINPSFKVVSVSTDRPRPGDEIEIRGRGFYGSASAYRVEFKSGDEIASSAVKQIDKTSIKTDVPSDLHTGIYTLSVSSGTENEDTYYSEGALELKIEGTSANPEITSFFPASGFEGEEITVNGRNFSGVSAQNKAYLIIDGQQAAAEITVASSNSITFKVPQTQGKDNIVTKIIINVYGFVEISTADNSFTIRKPLYISEVNPNTGEVGEVVRIHFANLDGINDVIERKATFNNYNAEITGVATNSMDVKVPSAGEGDYDVKITFKNKKSQTEETAESPNKFKIKSLNPIIESYSPNKIGPGYLLTLTGKNFSTEQNTVVFVGDDADYTATILSMTAAELKIKTPSFAGATQVYKNYDIVVFSTINGEQRRSERKTIAVTDEPYIIEVDPTNSKMNDIITIKGFNFNPIGIDAANFPVVTFSTDGNTSEIKGVANLEKIDDETIKVKVPDSGRYDVLWNRVRVKTADYKVSNYADIKVVKNP